MWKRASGVPYEQSAVRRRRPRLKFLDVGAESRKAEPSTLVVEQIERRVIGALVPAGAGASEIPQFPATTVVTP